MFGFLKSLLQRPAPPPEGSDLPPGIETALPTTECSPHYTPAARGAVAQTEAGRGAAAPAGRGVQLPLASILAGLPAELQPKVRPDAPGEGVVAIPLEKVLAQLARGAVKITFGELRHAAPEAFTPGTDRDRVLITLPLQEILARLSPALIKRRRVQKRVEVPADIVSPFDTQGGPGEPSPASLADERPAIPRLPARTREGAENPAIPFVSNRGSLSFAPTPPPPAATPANAPPSFPAPRSAYTSLPRPPTRPVAPSPAVPAPGAKPLLLELAAVVEGWPEPVLNEISELKLGGATLAVPADLVEQALRRGRVVFSWKALRTWLRPAPATTASAHEEAMLELPLKVVAPLFLARAKQGQGQQKVVVDEAIPNLFFGFPQREPAAATPPPAPFRPGDTNFIPRDNGAGEHTPQQGGAPHAASPGTRFVAKYATPNEIVSRAAGLDGVAGALIALPDGLLVASRLPQDVNADTLAAFLPQIFSKVSQSTKELRLGELNNLNFTVGTTSWKIFRVNAIFFAAFARAGEPLPTAQLAALAAELDHKPK